jgi:hypothetical protein
MGKVDETAMRVVCAWCQQEGRSHLLRVGEPLDDTSETHGICDRHQQAILELFPSNSFPSTRWLFVVSPDQPGAYKHLLRVMEDVAAVTVIVDRRRGERRRVSIRPPEERRRSDRRVRRPERSALGYMLVRFAPREVASGTENPPAEPSEPEGVAVCREVARA